MKKDLEWVRQEILREFEEEDRSKPYAHGFRDGLRIALSKINQLDESETLSVVEEDPEYVIQSKEDTTLYLEAYELGSGGHENWTNKDNCWWTRDRRKAEAVAYLVDGTVEELEE